jgi:hypothetical protein
MAENKINPAVITVFGIILTATGGGYFLASVTQTVWLVFVPVALAGVLFYFLGFRQGDGWFFPGGIFLGGGMGMMTAAVLWDRLPVAQSLGLAAGGLALGFWITWLVLWIKTKKTSLWAFFVGAVIASTAAALLFSPLGLLDFCLYILTGTGLAFIIWGLADSLLGLIIPGCIVTGIGPGVYLAWHDLTQVNGLTETGVMLVVFALGWFSIVPLSRLVTQKFIWWPLIPAGILAVTGWGLYIGGSPASAPAFIGNTGSLALVIFGLYLLFWRRGIRR